MTTTNNTPARVGRERTCAQCGTVYRSPRNSSRYCTPACRKKANRGAAPTGGPQAGPSGFDTITKALLLAGFVGRIGPTSSRDQDAPVYALLVPREYALDELSYQFNRRGFGYLSREEFSAALRRDGIKDFDTRSPEAIERKHWQDRQGVAIRRTA